MDGNRRYARKKNMVVQAGHVDGYVALRRVSRVSSEQTVIYGAL
jgi:ditrans,polycis-polyprenyl diphosphate synthase